MQYLLLIYDNESERDRITDEERAEMMRAYGEFTRAIKESGQFVAGDALQSVSTATTVRVRDGNTLTLDGPFAETKEQLGGYYLVNASDLDEALALAARIPTAKRGSIEVRPIMVWD